MELSSTEIAEQELLIGKINALTGVLKLYSDHIGLVPTITTLCEEKLKILIPQIKT